MVLVMYIPRCLRRIATVAVLLVVVAGCQKAEPARKPTFAVRGQILDGLKPLANATVVFHPEDGVAEKPRGTTDANGEFSLTTYDLGDGAPAGQYRVTVELWATVSADGGPVNRVPARFAKPETSGFTATVADGPTTLQPFTLKK
jgi:hypothetical protein